MGKTYLPSVLVFAFTMLTSAQLPARKAIDPNPWNGTWRLDLGRSSPGVKEAGAPLAYRLLLGRADTPIVPIKWEIPELGEVVTGLTDGKPMPIVRRIAAPGLALTVRTDGDAALVYGLYKNGELVGGGRMMLIDNGKAWVDLTWPDDRQDLASELVYVKENPA